MVSQRKAAKLQTMPLQKVAKILQPLKPRNLQTRRKREMLPRMWTPASRNCQQRISSRKGRRGNLSQVQFSNPLCKFLLVKWHIVRKSLFGEMLDWLSQFSSSCRMVRHRWQQKHKRLCVRLVLQDMIWRGFPGLMPPPCVDLLVASSQVCLLTSALKSLSSWCPSVVSWWGTPWAKSTRSNCIRTKRGTWRVTVCAATSR